MPVRVVENECLSGRANVRQAGQAARLCSQAQTRPLQTQAQAQAHVLQLHGSGMRAWDWGPGGEERPCTWGDMASHGQRLV